MKRFGALMLAFLMLAGMIPACSAAASAETPDNEEVLISEEPADAVVEEVEAFLSEDGVVCAEEAGDDWDPEDAIACETPADALVLAPEAEKEAAVPTAGEEAGPIMLTVTKKASVTVYVGSTYQIEVPEKAIQSCSSSSRKIAKVTRSGLITPKKEGKAKITIKLSKKKKIVLTLKVVDPTIPKKVTFAEGKKLTVFVGETIHLTPTVSPATASQAVKWKSSKKSVATVDASGAITTHRTGKTTITATTPNKKAAKLVLTVVRPARQPRPHFMISHAMGGIDGRDYSSSLEAFRENYAEGHRAFEVDLIYTSDGRLVLWHTWANQVCSSMPKNYQPTFAEFMHAKIYDRYTPLSMEDLLKLMAQYPDIIVMTDTKYTDAATARKQFQAIVDAARAMGVSDVLNRMVVSIYNKKMFPVVRGVYPFRGYIFTLYKLFKKAPTADQLKDIANFCVNNGIGTVGMYTKWWKDSYMDILDDYGLKAGLYTTNSKSDALAFFDSGVTSLCTDFLPPLTNTTIVF